MAIFCILAFSDQFKSTCSMASAFPSQFLLRDKLPFFFILSEMAFLCFNKLNTAVWGIPSFEKACRWLHFVMSLYIFSISCFSLTLKSLLLCMLLTFDRILNDHLIKKLFGSRESQFFTSLIWLLLVILFCVCVSFLSFLFHLLSKEGDKEHCWMQNKMCDIVQKKKASIVLLLTNIFWTEKLLRVFLILCGNRLKYRKLQQYWFY